MLVKCLLHSLIGLQFYLLSLLQYYVAILFLFTFCVLEGRVTICHN